MIPINPTDYLPPGPSLGPLSNWLGVKISTIIGIVWFVGLCVGIGFLAWNLSKFAIAKNKGHAMTIGEALENMIGPVISIISLCSLSTLLTAIIG